MVLPLFSFSLFRFSFTYKPLRFLVQRENGFRTSAVFVVQFVVLLVVHSITEIPVIVYVLSLHVITGQYSYVRRKESERQLKGQRVRITIADSLEKLVSVVHFPFGTKSENVLIKRIALLHEHTHIERDIRSHRASFGLQERQFQPMRIQKATNETNENEKLENDEQRDCSLCSYYEVRIDDVIRCYNLTWLLIQNTLTRKHNTDT